MAVLQVNIRLAGSLGFLLVVILEFLEENIW